MSALALYLEDEGIPTVALSLVREHTAAMRPPRALWVPFMLGRPLGAPGDAAFQRRVLLAALRLFEREAGPVLEDFPDEAPPDAGLVGDAGDPSLVCPVSFAGPEDAPLRERVADEISQLATWHELAVARRGRTTLGVAGAEPAELAAFLATWAEGEPAAAWRDDVPPGDALRLACEELKAYYLEANSAQPGLRTPGEALHWFFNATCAGELFRAVERVASQHEDADIRYFAERNLVPRAASEGAA